MLAKKIDMFQSEAEKQKTVSIHFQKHIHQPKSEMCDIFSILNLRYGWFPSKALTYIRENTKTKQFCSLLIFQYFRSEFLENMQHLLSKIEMSSV